MSRVGKVTIGTISVVLFIITAALLTGAGVLAWLYGTQRSPEGFLDSPTAVMTTDGYAITSSSFDIEGVAEEWLPEEFLGTFRTEIASVDGGPLFIGIGPSDDVEDYLADVAHIEVTRFGSDQRVSFDEHSGSRVPGLPAAQAFWILSDDGAGSLSLDWTPESGSWTLVVMNADGSPTLDVEASVGLDTPWLLGGMFALGGLAFLTGIVAVVLAVLAFRRTTTVEPKEPASPEPARVPR